MVIKVKKNLTCFKPAAGVCVIAVTQGCNFMTAFLEDSVPA